MYGHFYFFHSLLEQMKSPRVKAVVGVLQVAKSKALRKWKELVRISIHLSEIKKELDTNFDYQAVYNKP